MNSIPIVAPLNTGQVSSKIVLGIPDVSTPAEYIGQEFYVKNQQKYYKNIGYEHGIGYLWVEVSNASSASPSSLVWSTIVTGSSVVIQPNHGYYIPSPDPVSMTISDGFDIGSVFEIRCGQAFGGVTINLNESQTAYVNSVSTTGGSIVCKGNGTSMVFTCVSADALWSCTPTGSLIIY